MGWVVPSMLVSFSAVREVVIVDVSSVTAIERSCHMLLEFFSSTLSCDRCGGASIDIFCICEGVLDA